MPCLGIIEVKQNMCYISLLYVVKELSIFDTINRFQTSRIMGNRLHILITDCNL